MQLPNNLKHLTKEEKLELIRALEAKEQKRKEVRAGLSLHPGQVRVRTSKSKTKIVTCGNGWGKSTFAVDFIRDRALGTDKIWNITTKVPLRIIVVLDHPTKVDDVYKTEYNKWYDYGAEITPDKMGTPYVKQWNFRNGSFVRFMTWDQDEVTFESVECDLLVFDEPPPRRIFIALSRGQRNKKVQPETLIVGTPVTAEAAWLREDFVQPWVEGKRPDVECFTGSTSENESNLGDGYLERFGQLLNEKEREIRLHGAFASVDSLAFGHLISDVSHLVAKEAFSWDYSWPCVVGIDNATSKAHVAVLVGRRPGDDKLFVLKEVTAKVTAREFASHLYSMTAGYKVVDWICDSAGQAEATGHEGFKSFIEVLNSCGIRARATTFADKLYEDAVERIRGMLAYEDSGPPLFEKSPRLRFVEDGAPRAYKELKNITWIYDKKNETNKPQLNSRKLDFFSALTYALSSTHLAKTLSSCGIITTGIDASRGAGATMARGLGITTSKGSNRPHRMRRFYTKTGLSRDDDE